VGEWWQCNTCICSQWLLIRKIVPEKCSTRVAFAKQWQAQIPHIVQAAACGVIERRGQRLVSVDFNKAGGFAHVD